MADLILDSSEINLTAADEGEPNKLRRFTIVAYRGGKLILPNWKYPVVVDLDSVILGDQIRPALLNHDMKNVGSVLGQTDSIRVENYILSAEGDVMGISPDVSYAVGLNDNGFRWKASIGASKGQPEFVATGESANVNGMDQTGPYFIARGCELGEISFVVRGADAGSDARIAATAATGSIMSFEDFVRSLGFDPAALSPEQQAGLQTLFEASGQGAPPPADPATSAEESPPPIPPAAPGEKKKEDEVAASGVPLDITATDRAEIYRINAIAAVCHGERGDFPDIEAQAVENNWTVRQARVAVIRNSRPGAPAAHIHNNQVNQQVIEASLCMANGIRSSDIEANGWYSEQVLDAASSRQWRGMTPTRLAHECIRARGGHVHGTRLDSDGIRAAFEADNLAIRAGFSTLSLSGSLGNLANKRMLTAFLKFNSVIRTIAYTQSTPDFKTFNSYQITGLGQMREVGQDGVLKDITLGEEEFPNRVKTNGCILTITEEQWYNDDLGVFNTLSSALGRMAMVGLERAGFTVFLGSNFFSEANGNYMEGADTALSIDSLTEASALVDNMGDANEDPILIPFNRILVPPALKITANSLYKDTTIVQAATNKTPAGNPHAGSYEPVMSPYCGTKYGLTGSSDEAFYLLPDASDVAPLQLAFLNGQENPTIEKGETSFNTLGMSWRMVYRFGFAKGNKRGVLKSKGKA